MALTGNRNIRGNKGPRKDTRKYLNGKQGKTDEIRKALTHRARLRKNYFKLLEREGLDVPSKEGSDIVEEHYRKERAADDNDNDSENETEENEGPKSEIDIIKEKVKEHKPLTFQERMALKKSRKELDKQRKMESTKKKIQKMKEENYQRQRQTERIRNTKTRKGQPLMGPRINSLLEKIQQDKTNNK